MEATMDRRQRKTREAIFTAFIDLLSCKDFGQITVGQIIEKADVGRATFYAHFETKEFLLKALCDDLFCHIFDAEDRSCCEHNHMFQCDAPDEVFLHLFQHLLKNDNQVLQLLSCQNNTLFLQYFKAQLKTMVQDHIALFAHRKSDVLPEGFWVDHICATFVEALRWWIDNGMTQSPETITQYFYLAV